MALFGSKKKKEEKAPAPSQTKAAKQTESTPGVRTTVAHVLKNPRITEKASMHQGSGIYTFDVETSATKSEILSAVREVYKVTPLKIRIVQVPSKQTRSMRTGRRGMKSGGKKAYVYLKNGESITIA